MILRARFVLFLLPVVLIAACATGRHGTATALVDYVNQEILSISPLEEKALAAYASVTGENFKSEQEVLDTLEQEVIPTYEEFYRSLRRVPIQDREIGRLHNHYVRSASLLLEGFKTKALGLEKGDERLVVAGNQRIEAGRDEALRWGEALFALCKEYNVGTETKGD